MIVLDENVSEAQRLLLRSWRIRARQIGLDVGRAGIKDDEIIPLLRSLKNPTFVTRDEDFHDRGFCDRAYGIVVVAAGRQEVATYVRRLLRHPRFNRKVDRLGKVLCLGPGGVRCWQRNPADDEHVQW